MSLSIVLPLRNQATLTSLLGRIYDPSSPDYHKFLSAEQFSEQFAPSPEDYQAVAAYAQANGFTVGDTPANRLIVPITGTVAQVENAFSVRMGLYHHPTENRLFFSPDREPSVNAAVPIAHIAGLNNYSIPHPTFQRASTQSAANAGNAGSGPGGSFLASDMRTAYYGGTALTGAGQTVGLLEFDGYNQSDVNLTFSSAGQSYNVPIQNVLLDGATGGPTSGDDSEEVLDIVQTIGMAPGLSQVRVYIGGNDVDILNAIASEDRAQEVSISWSWSPDDPATDDAFFEEYAAQGQSVFASSGDWGAFDPYFDNFYPAEDAYVTAVGGTDLSTQGGAWASETAWDRSGGGISPDGFAMPAWQSGVATSTNGGSNTLRNVPDVAAQADFVNYSCAMGSCAGDYGGTSFSAPRWAAFMALANQQAVSAGNPTIGFINPALYAIGEGTNYSTDFHDITSGNNNTRNNCCGWPYYNAVPGYDLVTGWGSPNGQALIDDLAPLSAASFTLSASTASLTVLSGNSGTVNISVKSQSGSTVTLSASGFPAGVTAAWTQNPAVSSSALTLNVGSSVPRGPYLITVNGIAGSVTETTSFVLEVTAPGFSLVPSPSSLTIHPGTSGSTSIVISDYSGFNGSVNLAVTSGLPSGVTASWVGDPATGSAMLTLTASSSATPNTDAIVTVTGTSGNLTATTTLALIVSSPTFYVNMSPYPSTIAQGASISTTVTVTAVPANSSTQTINLSAPQLPSGVTATFNPAQISVGQSSTLTLTASSSAATGTSMAGIEAQSSSTGTLTQFPLTVTAKATPYFTLTVAQSAPTVTQGASVSDAVTVTPQSGFNSSVSLAVSPSTPLPGGVTATFSPSATTSSSQLTFTASSTAIAGLYPIQIAGASGTQTAVANVYLTLNPPALFSLSTSPAAVSVTPNGSTTDAITINPQSGFTGSVQLAVVSGLPAGLTASFAPATATSNSTLTLSASGTVAAGSYMLTIAGIASGHTVTATLPVTVIGGAAISTSTSLTISPSGSLAPGSAYTLTAQVTAASGSAAPTGNVIFTVGSSQTQTVALNSAGVATYAGAAPASAGTLTITATYQGQGEFSASTSSTLSETVGEADTPAFALAGTSVTVNAGATMGNSSTITITPSGGFTGSIKLTASIADSPTNAQNLPTLSFTANSISVNGSSPATATLVISTSGGTTTASNTAGHDKFPWYTSGGATLACLLLFGIPARRRRWQSLLGAVILLIALTSGAVGCGGMVVSPTAQSSSGGTTPGVYLITVNATSGTTTATTTVSLTVQ